MVKSRLSPVTVLYLSPERYFIHVKKIFEAAGAEVQKQTVLSVLLQGLLLSKLDCFSNEFQTAWKVATTTVTTAAKATTTAAKATSTTAAKVTTTAAKATSNDNNDNCNKWKISSLQQKLLGRNSEITKFLFLTFFKNKKILKPKNRAEIYFANFYK